MRHHIQSFASTGPGEGCPEKERNLREEGVGQLHNEHHFSKVLLDSVIEIQLCLDLNWSAPLAFLTSVRHLLCPGRGEW